MQCRIVSLEDDSIDIECQTECERCGSSIDVHFGMTLGKREGKIILYCDESSLCKSCWLLSEGGYFGFPTRHTSRIFQNVEGVWFLTMNLPNQNARNDLKAILDVEFADNRLPFEFFQATSTDFILTGARLELRYFQQILSTKNIASELLSKQSWLLQQKSSNPE